MAADMLKSFRMLSVELKHINISAPGWNAFREKSTSCWSWRIQRISTCRKNGLRGGGTRIPLASFTACNQA